MPTSPRPSLRPWYLWMGCFLAAWLAIVVTGHHWQAVVEHWATALAMALGSYVAGSTPMGGGTVGFPVLVLILGETPTLGRDFSFAVQSIGMTSASIFILCRRQPLEWPMLRWTMLGSLVGTPLGIFFIAPHTSALVIKLTFAVVWCSFGVLHLYRLREFSRHAGLAPGSERFDRRAGLLIGLLAGGLVAAVIGVGIDLVIYAVLVLLCQSDLKIAIPTAVLIMAFTSLIGIATKVLTHTVQPGVFEHWLAAAPVAAFGAPLGAFIVAKIGRISTLFVVSLLCILQFVWMISDEWLTLGWLGLAAVLGGVVLVNLGFQWLHQIGRRLDRRKGSG